MPSLRYAKTLGSCSEAFIRRDDRTVLFISITARADTLSIIHGVCINLTNQGMEVLKTGIATALLKAQVSFSSAAADASKNGAIRIPLREEILPGCILEIFYSSRGRTLPKLLAIKE